MKTKNSNPVRHHSLPRAGFSILLWLVGALLALVATGEREVVAAPLGTAFTYQGRLNDGGSPATGTYELRLTMYDAVTEGNAVAEPLTNSPVDITNGLMTIVLDFGTNVFNGEARWLEISVRSYGSAGDFTVLTPRQALTPAPYAAYAPSAGSAAGVTGPVAANQLTGVVSPDQIAPGSISGTMLADGAVGSAQLASNLTVTGTVSAGSF